MRQKTEAPWIALGISRATWYRHGKPTTRPLRNTQTMIAKNFQITVRGLQRARRLARDAPDLAAQIAAGGLKLGTAEKLLIQRQEAAALDWLRAELAKRRTN